MLATEILKYCNSWDTSVGTICLFVVLLLAVGNLCKILYRLWFHPLSSYPGPLLARVSSLWASVGAAKLRKAYMIQAAHEKYGPVVRISPDHLSYNHPTVLKEIYGHGAALPKSVFYDGGHFTDNDNLFSQRDKDAHSSRRSMLNKSFSQASLMSHMPILQANISRAFDHFSRLSDSGNSAVDIYNWAHWIALDFIFQIVLGFESGTLQSGENHSVIQNLESFQAGFAWVALFPPMRRHGSKVPIQSIRRPFELRDSWIKFTADQVRKLRAAEKETLTDIMRHLLEDFDSHLGRNLTDLEIVEEIISFFFAGSGTTANTIVFLVWSVLKDDKVLANLSEELRKTFPDPRSAPSPSEVNSLSYLNAVIKEALRKFPTIPGSQPRYVTKNDLALLGRRVPLGTTVSVQNYSIHRNEAIFPNPEVFDPERWLGAEGSGINQGFNGFGTGPRACIGRNLAFLELKAFVAGFFLRFDAKILPGFGDEHMKLTDGFAGGPAGESLPLILVDRAAHSSTNANKTK